MAYQLRKDTANWQQVLLYQSLQPRVYLQIQRIQIFLRYKWKCSGFSDLLTSFQPVTVNKRYSSDSSEEQSSNSPRRTDKSEKSTSPLNVEQRNMIQHQFVIVEVNIVWVSRDFQILLERKFEVVSALSEEVFQKEEDVEVAAYTESLINFFEGHGKSVPLLQHLTSQEVDQTRNRKP